jgi:hypothetical protein
MMSPLAHQAHKPLADGGSSWRISKANYLKRSPAVAPRGLFASVRLAYLGHIMLSRPRILPARFIAPCLPTKTERRLRAGCGCTKSNVAKMLVRDATPSRNIAPVTRPAEGLVVHQFEFQPSSRMARS